MDNTEESTGLGQGDAPDEPTPRPEKRKRAVPIFVSIAVVIAAAAGGWFVMSLIAPQESASDVATTAVTEMKKVTTFPQMVDEVTTLDDVTSEGSAINYQYTITGADMSTVTEQAISDGVLPQLCSNEDTRALLDRGVEMQYSYVVSETGDTFDLSFTESDC